MSVTFPCWARVSNAVEDPQSRTSVAQDEVVKLISEDGDWYVMETLDGTVGRVPKILAIFISNPLRLPSERICCSIAQFDPQCDRDLPFGIYSIIVVESFESEGWLKGIVVTDNGKRLGNSGTFPASHVKELSDFTVPTDPQLSSGFSDVNLHGISSTSNVASNYVVGPYARAVYPFTGEFGNELTFQADEIISLTKRIDNDWLEGCVGGRSGIFPQSFVQIVVDLPGEVQSDKRNSTAEEGIGFAIVRHDFEGRQSDELSVKMGDSVRILKMVNADWVMCNDPGSDKSGIVPVAFLEMYLDEDEDETKDIVSRPHSIVEQTFSSLTDSSFATPTTVPDWRTSTRLDGSLVYSAPTQSHEWAVFGEEWNMASEKKAVAPARPPPPKPNSVQSPSDVLSITEMFGMSDRQGPPRPIAPATILSSPPNTDLSHQEKKAKVLEELINTELQFITDINAYTEAVDGSTRLTPKQKVIMKNGCAQIVQLAGALVQGLTNEQMKSWEQQAIGECFLRLRKSFGNTYGYYFRNIDHINTMLMLSKTDAKMEAALRDLVVRMRASGAGVFDASTAVSRPVQRCVKYPLFLSEIAKYTPISHPDHPKLLEAVKQLSNLGSKMNESKRRKELTRKYSEEQSNNSFGDMLSKLTMHSIKKKSNRFTYRMGSSLGVVKLTRDGDFDRLVCELDGAERRLVRFNYMLVIYRKKMFFETRQLIQKKVVEPRKKQIPGVSADAQTMVFHDMVKDLAVDLNSRVRDEIVKALRAIPKKLIRKRNDKLMDYEAVKSSTKVRSDLMSKFKDFEALNNQVKQTLPKVIDVLNSVLRDAMKTVDELDSALIARIRTRFQEEISAYHSDPLANTSHLIVPGMSCFANYYDPDRLKPLHNIVNKASKFVRLNSRSSSPLKAKDSVAKCEHKEVEGLSDAPSDGKFSTEGYKLNEKKAFRAQTIEERKQILIKADLKNRRADIYRCKSNWPASLDALEQNKILGKMLIVNEGDAVLAVRKDPCNMWLCYNGYYNAVLPSTILTPWYSSSNGASGNNALVVNGHIEAALDELSAIQLSPSKQTPILSRPHSTPPKQPNKNLIDLDDDLFSASSISALVPQPLVIPTVNSLTPTPVGGVTSTVAVEGTYSNSEIHEINWGTLPVPQSGRAPSLPNLNQTATSFPVTFDESPKFHQPTHLPPAPSRSSVPNTNGDNSQDAFTTLWEQIKNIPMSSIVQRSDSPQPLIPTRPEPLPLQPTTVPAAFTCFSQQNSSQVTTQPTTLNLTSAFCHQPSISVASTKESLPTYDLVPTNYSSTNYQYSTISSCDNSYRPTSKAITNRGTVFYEEPPPDGHERAVDQYDNPPVEIQPLRMVPVSPGDRLPLGQVIVEFDFSPVGPNQLAVHEGEQLALIQNHDDDGNPEWIWVRRENNENGYIPAAYCRTI